MEKLQNFLFLLITLCSFQLLAQEGTIRGVITDDETGETLIGVTVLIAGTDNGTATDLDGSFELNLTPGTYALEISYVSFETMNITDIVVEEGKVNFMENIRLLKESEMLEEVVITANVIRTSEAALMTLKKKSTSLIDGISSSKFKKIGDSNASEAVKRVTGVSVEGGKYVFVRGLGDRYTKTMLNGVDIPGLDPDRNSLQIDIFPTSLLNNMMIYKSADASLPADFTGGLVNIETKDFPEEKTFDLSFGVGYNPSMHFNPDYLDYEGGKTDWLAYDDGTRRLSTTAKIFESPRPVSDSDAKIERYMNGFTRTFAAQTKSSLPDFSLGLSLGNQISLKNDHKIGYIFSGTYKSSRNFYDDVTYGDYQVVGESDAFELLPSTTINGAQGEENILLGGMAGLAYKTSKTKHKFNFIHLRNGESKAAKLEIDNNSDAAGQSGYIAYSDNLEYSERSLTNALLHGDYVLGNDWKLEWKASSTLSKLTDPDIRKTAFTEFGSNRLILAAGGGGLPSRRWRFLDEINYVTKIDLEKKLVLFDEEAKLKFGLSRVYKERDYNILTFNLQPWSAQPNWSGNASEVGEFFYPEGPMYYVSGNNIINNSNEYNSNVQNLAAYVSSHFNPFPSLKATVGLRAEKYIQKHTGRDIEFSQTGISGNNLEDETVLDALDLFPSLNLIQSLKEDMNLRFSYSRSIARPSFKELSFAQILDPITDRIFNGSFFTYSDSDGNVIWDGNLQETRIDNLDLRWEKFSPGGQLISFSGFYKYFRDPIELVRITLAITSSEFQPRNVGDGQVYGVELELRRNIPVGLNRLGFSSNITLAHSKIEMSEAEYNSRLPFVKDGEELSRTRQMAGQSPYIINAGLTFSNPEKAFDAGLYYNVKGRTLEIVGGGLFPDVMNNSFHSLNFSLNYSFGQDDKVKLGLNIDNLLNSRRESVYESFQAADQIFSRLYPRTSFGLSLGYSIY